MTGTKVPIKITKEHGTLVPIYDMMILKQKREEKGYTQAQIAEKAGLSVRGYRKIESGKVKPSCDVIVVFQREFGLAIDILLSEATNS